MIREADCKMDMPEKRKQRAITSEKIDQTTPAFKIVDSFGGLSRFAEECDYSTSTVYRWLLSGLIPMRKRADPAEGGQISHQAWIMRHAKRLGIDISAEDFIDEAI